MHHANQNGPHHDLHPRRNRLIYKLCAETLIWNSGGVLVPSWGPGCISVVGVDT